MRIIKIVADGIPMELYDDTDKPLEELTKEVITIMKTNVVATLVGKGSAIIVRPSKVSGINIIDDETESAPQIQKKVEPVKKGEQKTEHVDMIIDLQK